MTTYQTAAEAIDHSIMHDEIAHCEDTPENRRNLLEMCDGEFAAVAFWAHDPKSEYKMRWRVMVELIDA